MIKATLVAFFSAVVVASAQADTLTVCASGCQYPTAQAALDASRNGDTIILKSGENLGGLTIPGGRHDLTIKSSGIDSYPHDTRIERRDPSLARLTTITVGESNGWVGGILGSSLLTSRPGDVVQPHHLAVGDKVVVGGSLFSAYHCASLNQPPYTTGACDASRVGFFNIRMDSGLSNNTVLFLKGRNLPSPLLENTPYYVVNFAFGGSVSNADKFQIAATAGGSPVVVPAFDPFGRELVIMVPPLPQAINDVMYVVNTPTVSTLELSPTPGGPPTVWTQIGKYYNGSRLSYGFSVTKVAPVYNITFDGIELFPASDYGVYYPFDVSRAAGIEEGENHDLHILRCWLHGSDDQESFPMTMLNIGGHDLDIGWNIIEGAYSTSNDTQGIGFMSTGQVTIHDNEIKGATEGILSGGNFPWFAFRRNTDGIKVLRNYFWKPMKAYIGISAVAIGPTQFQLVSRLANNDCASVAADPNLGLRCFAYEGESERCDTSAPLPTRFEWQQSAANSLFTAAGSAGQKGYIYLLNGLIHMDYNFSGAVVCPSSVVCTPVANPSFPVNSTRLSMAVIGAGGTFDGSFYQENRNVWSKNFIESKYGDHWLIEGNVFSGQANCDSGSTCQDPAIQLTVSPNGSGGGEPVNYMVSTSNSIIRNNIFQHLSAGIVGVGKTFAINNGGTGLAYEFAGFGQNINNRVENNLFMDMGSTEYSSFYGGAVVRTQNTEGWTVEHNTAVDVRIGFLSFGDKSSIYRSNILVPYRSACPGNPSFCTSPAATSHTGVQNDTGGPPFPSFGSDGAASWGSALAQGKVDAASHFDNNIVMNRSGFIYNAARGVAYPQSTYLIQPDDAGRDPNALFLKWQERDNAAPPNGCLYQAANYRLAAGQAAAYPAYDGQAIGADIDAIETFTGANGNEVAKGGTWTDPPPVSWTPPLLDWPAFAPLSRSLTLNYGDDPVAHVMWDFSPVNAVASSYGNFSPRTSGASGTVSFTTTSGTMNPAQQGLSLGAYHVTVQLQDAQGIVQMQATRDITFVNADLSGLKVYPNPWRKDKHASKNVSFANLPTGSTVKLFTVSGHLVKEYGPPATGNGTASWDLTNDSGDKVASGVYVYVVIDAEGKKIKGKLAIIR